MNKIRELRKERDLTLTNLSKELQEKENLKIGSNALGKYERGLREPKLKTWIKLADFFNVPVSYIQGTSNIRDLKAFKDYETFSKCFDKSRGIPSKEFKSYMRDKNLKSLYMIFNSLIDDNDIYTPELVKHYQNILNSIDDQTIFDITNDLNIFLVMLLDGVNGNEKVIKVLHDIFDILVDNGFLPFNDFDQKNR